MNGLINLYKPSLMSSAKAVAKVKHILGEKRVGHMGTLDPMAQGVLVIGVGKSTRLFDYLSGERKSYVCKFKFGIETDTLDALGETVNTTRDIPSVDAVYAAMQSLIGVQEQVPPVYSAKHVDGKRAYALARSGETVELKSSKIEIFGTELVCQPAMDEFVFTVDCSAGTYIRSICRDVAKMCGSLATLTYLQRTRSGRFNVNDAVTLENLDIVKGGAVIPPEKILDLPRYDVPAKDKQDLDFGRPILCENDGDFAVFCEDVLYGIGRAEKGVLKIKTYLKDD